MEKNQIIIIAAVVILAVVGFIFLQGQKSTNPQVATNEVVETPLATDTAALGTVKEFTVTGSAFKFDPTEIRVNKGDRVKIAFKNAGGTHDFRLDEFGVKTNIIQGEQEETVDFVANKAGSFEYYCSVANHRQMGMKGMLIVE